MSSIVNKIKDAVQPHNSEPEGSHGPHHSKVGNATDPRIDSDRDNRDRHAAGTTGLTGAGHSGVGHTGAGHTGTTGTTGTHNNDYTSNNNHAYNNTSAQNTTAGPHKSNLMNKADPRVDSDRTGHQAMGGTGSGMPAANLTSGDHRSPNTAGNQPMGGVGSGISAANHTAGPHSSGAMNKADPRFDSDLDGSRNMGMNNNHHNAQGYPRSGATNQEGVHGPHQSRVANAADPRVDSDRDGSKNVGGTHTGAHTGVHNGTHNGAHTGTHSGTHSGTHAGTHTGAHTGTHGTQGTIGGAARHNGGPGPAPNTAGPHKQDMLNKLDPRVDSNLDGSKTLGADKTYAQSNVHDRSRNPEDASQVPPSVMRQHQGGIEVHHDDPNHDRERRNSAAPPQEKHYMGGI